MSNLFALIVVAMFIEAAISYAQTVYEKGLIQWQIIVGYIMGAIICYDTGLNFLSILGLSETWPIIGILSTALVVCRGSNYLFEFYGQLTSWRKKAEDNGVMMAKKKAAKEEEEKKNEKKGINYIK